MKSPLFADQHKEQEPNDMSNNAGTPWPTWVRCLVLAAGLAASAAAGYLAALVSTLVAVMLDAAPLGLAGESTPRQPWVTPVVVAVGLSVFGLGVWLSVKAFRRHREQHD